MRGGQPGGNILLIAEEGGDEGVMKDIKPPQPQELNRPCKE